MCTGDPGAGMLGDGVEINESKSSMPRSKDGVELAPITSGVEPKNEIHTLS